MLDDPWLHWRARGGDDLPAAAERALRATRLAWQDEAAAKRHIHDALALAPDHLAVQTAAYKFIFYRRRLAEALPYARACLSEAQRRALLPADWRDVQTLRRRFRHAGTLAPLVPVRPHRCRLCPRPLRPHR